jgi:hypothetical protein
VKGAKRVEGSFGKFWVKIQFTLKKKMELYYSGDIFAVKKQRH